MQPYVITYVNLLEVQSNLTRICSEVNTGNVLLLRGKIEIHADYSRIPLSELVTLIAEYLMDSNATVILLLCCEYLLSFVLQLS